MNRIERTMASAAIRRAPPGRRSHGTDCRHCIFGCMLAAAALMCAVPAGAADSAQANLEQWQLRRLNAPTERELAHEREGNVYIYDGLTARDVDRALSAHFERIEYMMFVGTRKSGSTNAVDSDANSNADGNVEMESPGCM
ncbi:MAG: hypothetical protein K0M46_00215 [Thiobacillus sp.]|nr:hypothetical protein [Thiobacillus sp.]